MLSSKPDLGLKDLPGHFMKVLALALDDNVLALALALKIFMSLALALALASWTKSLITRHGISWLRVTIVYPPERELEFPIDRLPPVQTLSTHNDVNRS